MKENVKSQIETYIETVSPETALEYLNYNQNWRKPTEHRVAAYARDMAEGNWELNGESIKFDENGWLVDGQNRLSACVASGQPFQTVIVRGIKTTDQVDRGQLRNFNQLLAHHGHENAGRLGSVLNQLWRYEKTGKIGMNGGRIKPTDNELLKLLRNNPEVKSSLKKIHGAASLFTNFALLAALHYLFTQKTNSDLADRFFEGVIKGSNLSDLDARFHLRARFFANKANKGKLLGVEIAALTIKAFNAFVEERAVTRLHWRSVGDSPERFPEIIDKSDIATSTEHLFQSEATQ